MIRSLEPLEHNLSELFLEKAPALPASSKQTLTRYLPLISLILGVLTLYSAWSLWHWDHSVSSFINQVNTSGIPATNPWISPYHMGLGAWLGLIGLIVEALTYFAAFSAAQDRKPSGWDLLFYAALLNIACNVAILFSDFGSLGGLLSSAVVSGVGLYLLFQIRATYLKQPSSKQP